MSIWDLRQWIEQSLPWWVLLVPFMLGVGLFLLGWLQGRK